MTIKAILVKSGYGDSSVYSGVYTITHTLATPTASPVAGAHTSAQNVTLSGEEGSTIYYTTNGIDPTITDDVYSDPISIPIDSSMTIKALSVKSGYGDSAIYSGDFTTTHILATPVASPVAGTFVYAAQDVTLSGEAGSTIYYTTDGSDPTTESSVYSSAINVPIDTIMNIKALAVKSGYGDSPIYSGTFTITHTLATPSASPAAGNFTSAQTITLSTEEGSTTYYTTDGSDPTTGSSVYSTGISVPGDTTITLKAFSVKEGYGDSAVYSGGVYTTTHQLSTPVASPSAGSFTSAQSVTLSGEVGSTIYYTTNGSTPTTGSTLYSGAISVPLDTTTTIKAYSVKNGYADSEVYSGTFTVTHTLSTPTTSPVAGDYSTPQNITLSGEAGSTIYYTTNGDTPTTGSTLYSGAITLNATTTLKAIAVKSGYANSGVYSGTYKVCPATGGTITVSGNYCISTFTSNGTFTPTFSGAVEALVVAGGGGGGSGHRGGGGGAGGLLYDYVAVSAQAYPVTVGAGGIGSTPYYTAGPGTNGGNSIFGTLTAIGGGAGGGGSYMPGSAGGSGGGGGAADGSSAQSSGGSGVSGQGYAGSYGSGVYGGGGGGASEAGMTDGPFTGGDGLQYSQFSSVGGSPAGWFAGGGAGSYYYGSAVYPGGTGGGGNHDSVTLTAYAGVANTGGGGAGGSRYGGTGGANGGSGIVIIKYPLFTDTASSKYVFVTASKWTGATLGGLAGADAKCQAAATAAGLPGAYKAWLSSESTSVTSRFSHSSVPYKRLDGVTIADNWADFWTGHTYGNLKANFSITETGTTQTGYVCTGDNLTGGSYSGFNCNSWTSSTSGILGSLDCLDHKEGGWLWNMAGGVCGFSCALYCVQQDWGTPVVQEMRGTNPYWPSVNGGALGVQECGDTFTTSSETLKITQIKIASNQWGTSPTHGFLRAGSCTGPNLASAPITNTTEVNINYVLSPNTTYCVGVDNGGASFHCLADGYGSRPPFPYASGNVTWVNQWAGSYGGVSPYFYGSGSGVLELQSITVVPPSTG